MKWILLISALLILAGLASADQSQNLKGNELDRSRIKVGMYAAVTYSSSKHKRETAKGYIRATDDHSLTVGEGLWKEKVAYQDIIQLTLGYNAKEVEAGLQAARAVSDARVRPGAHISVLAPTVVNGRVVEGTLVSLGADTLLMSDLARGTSLAISRTSIVRIEVYRGRKTNVAKGALLGFLGGAATGGILLAMSDSPEQTCSPGPNADPFSPFGNVCLGPSFSKGAVAPFVIGVFGAGGALIGTLMGAAIRTDKWEIVPIEQVRLGVLPQHQGGLVFAASFAF